MQPQMKNKNTLLQTPMQPCGSKQQKDPTSQSINTEGNENSTNSVITESRASSPFSKLKGFKIGHINIASLVKHHNELLVSKQSKSLDVSTVNETGLDKSVSDCKVGIPGYDIVGLDRNRNGAGLHYLFGKIYH